MGFCSNLILEIVDIDFLYEFSPSMVGDSRRLALRIHVPDAEVTKASVFDALMTVGQACDQIRHQIREIDGLDNCRFPDIILSV